MDKKAVKIVLGLIGLGLLVKIVAQKGGFLGASIGNKSENLQDIYKAFRDGNYKINSSNILDSQKFVEFNWDTPYGVQNSKFYEDGKFVFTKKYNNQTYQGVWKNNGELIVDGVGSINEGSITQSTLALNTMLL
jgi:hypothetical protein